MAINFPDSPTSGDTHTVGDKTWTWNGTSWDVVVSTPISNQIIDADGDTRIQVEESPDEDYIRFDTAGTERMTIGPTGDVAVTNDLSVTGTISGGSTSFPTSLDSGTMPAIEALQAKVGVDSSAVTTSLDYKVAQLEAGGSATAFTPTWTNFTAGNATQEWHYWETNGLVYVIGQTILGSTSAVTGVPTLTLPVTRETYANPIIDVGNGSLGKSGVATFAATIISTSTTTALFFCQDDPSYVREASTSATVPFTWATNDFIAGTIIYKAA